MDLAHYSLPSQDGMDVRTTSHKSDALNTVGLCAQVLVDVDHQFIIVWAKQVWKSTLLVNREPLPR